MPLRKTLYVCVSLDVEEEGLFGGSYERLRPQTRNIAYLPKLAPLSREFALPLTLLCAYAVFADKKARAILDALRGNCNVEIGTHLHHWNTPPPDDGRVGGPPMRTHLLPRATLAARLDSLMDAARDFIGQPARSFRMGRWDLKAPILPLLAERGIWVDSSICPLRAFPGGANHFLAPANPWIRPTPYGKIVEAPVTQLPLMPWLARFWANIAGKRQPLLDSFHFFGALSANPFWHGSAIMRQAVKRLVARGGNFLNLFWHSSELMPGGSPQTPDKAAADSHLRKIAAFFGWLHDNYNVEGLRMGQLAQMTETLDFPVLPEAAGRDW